MADLISGREVLKTGVENADAILAPLPAFWSYSSLHTVDLCPRRHELSRADYPDLWQRSGFPRSIALRAIKGSVIHSGIESIVKAFSRHNCPSVDSPEAGDAIRELGGLKAVAAKALDDELLRVRSNPRVTSEYAAHIERSLRNGLPEARKQIQIYLSRMPLVGKRSSPRPHGSGASSNDRMRGPLGLGDHAELALSDPELRITGRLDLLSVAQDGASITDFKTGDEQPAHLDQLRFYALLWSADKAANPRQLPVRSLTVSYPTHDVSVDIPGPSELKTLARAVTARIEASEEEIFRRPIRTNPGEHCALCDVRVLCDSYWTENAQLTSEIRDGEWYDIEGTMLPDSSARSWELLETRTGEVVTLRTNTTIERPPNDCRVRVLGVRRVINEEEPDSRTVAMAASSEVFKLT